MLHNGHIGSQMRTAVHVIVVMFHSRWYDVVTIAGVVGVLYVTAVVPRECCTVTGLFVYVLHVTKS